MDPVQAGVLIKSVGHLQTRGGVIGALKLVAGVYTIANGASTDWASAAAAHSARLRSTPGPHLALVGALLSPPPVSVMALLTSAPASCRPQSGVEGMGDHGWGPGARLLVVLCCARFSLGTRHCAVLTGGSSKCWLYLSLCLHSGRRESFPAPPHPSSPTKYCKEGEAEDRDTRRAGFQEGSSSVCSSTEVP